jgi:hypothetical protein
VTSFAPLGRNTKLSLDYSPDFLGKKITDCYETRATVRPKNKTKFWEKKVFGWKSPRVLAAAALTD